MNDPIVALKQDHKEARELLERLAESKPGSRRRTTFAKLEAALTLHMTIEEQLVYPLVPGIIDAESEEEAEVEHGLARTGLAQAKQLLDEPGFGAAIDMLTAGIKHHVKEEETEMFPKLKRGLERSDLAELGDRVQAMKKQARSRRAA